MSSGRMCIVRSYVQVASDLRVAHIIIIGSANFASHPPAGECDLQGVDCVDDGGDQDRLLLQKSGRMPALEPAQVRLLLRVA